MNNKSIAESIGMPKVMEYTAEEVYQYKSKNDGQWCICKKYEIPLYEKWEYETRTHIIQSSRERYLSFYEIALGMY
jgi:hypothetical protein